MTSKFEEKISKLKKPMPISRYFASNSLHPDSMTPEKVRQYQLDSLKEILKRAYTNNEMYRAKMDEAELTPNTFKTLEDIQNMPFLTKEDLRGNPYVLLTCEKEEIALVQVSTGTTGGEEIYMLYTWNDYYLHDLAPRYPKLFPIDPPDVCLNGLPYEMSAAGLAFHKTFMEGCNATVIPAGKGGAYSTPEKTLKMIRDLQPNVIITSPSWAIMLAEEAEKQNFDFKSLNLKYVYLTGEGCSPAFRRRVEKIFGATANFFYGSLECGVLGIECDDHSGYHLTEAHVYMEIIDPNTGEVLEPGEIGEIVITSMLRYDAPIIRFRTGDLGYIETEQCECGVTLPKFHLRGRVRDQIKYNGTSFSPFYLEEFLMSQPEVGNWYEFVIDPEEDNEEIHVRCELASDVEPSEELADSLASKMEYSTGIPFTFEFMEKLPRPQGKTIRVVYE
ncbi:phenylacetate--CoA ligase [Metabacillus litoralis]|uniref:Phenylacetate--CoA ligase n=1 Tax=Metabacillus litoralis TaxID=152268 RepID=A0A5C6WAU6_9BACI|nr:AMP-binding protein [Metabacillus litoralis]TXC93009.1 phenylacetate--CoA ligase [Metabacillus litoralis]